MTSLRFDIDMTATAPIGGLSLVVQSRSELAS
jgi:hypothetical protein